jgi:outer membrane protein assembly factor BamB
MSLLLVALGTLSQTDWPQYSGPTGDRAAAGALPTRAFAAGGPKSAWRVPLADGFSSFAVSGGKAYTLVSRERHETLVALDAASGKELWAARLSAVEYDGGADAGTDENQGGDGPRSTPSVADGRVVAYDAGLGLACFTPRAARSCGGTT